MFTTTITQAEILNRVRMLPEGKRRQELERAIVPIFTQDLAGRILKFDSDAADAFARIAAARRQVGRPISRFDAQIAAIASAPRRGNSHPKRPRFLRIGLIIINPRDFK